MKDQFESPSTFVGNQSSSVDGLETKYDFFDDFFGFVKLSSSYSLDKISISMIN